MSNDNNRSKWLTTNGRSTVIFKSLEDLEKPETATAACAEIQFGKANEDGHGIIVTWLGADGEIVQESSVHISDDDWEAASGSCYAEKLDWLLDWSNTEHDRDTTHVAW